MVRLVLCTFEGDEAGIEKSVDLPEKSFGVETRLSTDAREFDWKPSGEKSHNFLRSGYYEKTMLQKLSVFLEPNEKIM